MKIDATECTFHLTLTSFEESCGSQPLVTVSSVPNATYFASHYSIKSLLLGFFTSLPCCESLSGILCLPVHEISTENLWFLLDFLNYVHVFILKRICIKGSFAVGATEEVAFPFEVTKQIRCCLHLHFTNGINS